MNTHDIDSELPPLPRPDAEFGTHSPKQIRAYAIAAIEADRKRQYRPVYEEGWKDALEWASKRRGEPVACFKCGHSKHGGECVNVAPQPAESEKTDDICQECGGDGAGGEHEDDCSHGEPVGYFLNVNPGDERPRWEQVSDEYKNDHDIVALYTTPQPQKLPEDFVDDLAQEIRRVDGNHSLGAAALAERLVPFLARTLLEAAPQPQQIPEGYKLVPIEPTPEMLKSGWAENDVPLALRWKAMLEAVPEAKS